MFFILKNFLTSNLQPFLLGVRKLILKLFFFWIFFSFFYENETKSIVSWDFFLGVAIVVLKFSILFFFLRGVEKVWEIIGQILTQKKKFIILEKKFINFFCGEEESPQKLWKKILEFFFLRYFFFYLSVRRIFIFFGENAVGIWLFCFFLFFSCWFFAKNGQANFSFVIAVTLIFSDFQADFIKNIFERNPILQNRLFSRLGFFQNPIKGPQRRNVYKMIMIGPSGPKIWGAAAVSLALSWEVNRRYQMEETRRYEMRLREETRRLEMSQAHELRMLQEKQEHQFKMSQTGGQKRGSWGFF